MIRKTKREAALSTAKRDAALGEGKERSGKCRTDTRWTPRGEGGVFGKVMAQAMCQPGGRRN